MNFKVGDVVDNNGTTSKYRGQRGVITNIRQVTPRTGFNPSQSITVKYYSGKAETHPDRILEVVVPPYQFDNSLFTMEPL